LATAIITNNNVTTGLARRYRCAIVSR